MKITHAAHLSDAALVSEVGRLAQREREATVAFIVHLAEFDARRLYAAAGFSSTHRYCLEALHLSEDAAWNRIEAARMARAYPVVLGMLAEGALSPTTARMLRPHLTVENHAELLAAAAGRSKREVERLLAQMFPRPDVPASVRPLVAVPARPLAAGARAAISIGEGRPREAAPSRESVLPPESVPSAESVLPAESVPPAESLLPPDTEGKVPRTNASPGPPPVAAARPVTRPFSAERYEVRFTADAGTLEKLRRAQDLLAGSIRSGDLAQVFDRALSLLVADLERKKAAITQRPRTGPSSPNARRSSEGDGRSSRYLPAAVRRQVWERDDGRCAFLADNGRRCEARRHLEYHHGPVPYAVGGPATLDNIRLLCRAHNRYEAERFYGPGREYGGIDVGRERMTAEGRVAGAVTRSGTG